MIELMVTVAILGILAAIAIPHFSRYIKRAKTTEAEMNVRKLFDASVMYYASERGNRVGAIINKSFPSTVALTPTSGACCVTPGAKCQPSTYWTDPTWMALHFAVDDPFYYHYSYVSTGASTSAAFTAGAYGDLNCDNVYSTFERMGHVTGDTVEGSAAVYMTNEDE
jgi:type II secretory pathway pseudopilin PulG